MQQKKVLIFFLILKLHDIPNTVKNHSRTCFIANKNAHDSYLWWKRYDDGCNGGSKKLKIKVFGVTALTSLSDDDTI